MRLPRVGALVTVLISAAALTACGVSVNATGQTTTRPATTASITPTTLAGQLLAGPDVGSGYTASGYHDTSSPPPVDTPTNWDQISPSCQDWLHGFSGTNGGGGQHPVGFAQISVASGAAGTYYVFEWVGDFSGSDPARAVSTWSADGARCGSLTSKQKIASDDTTFNVSAVAAPSFGADTAATQDTYTSGAGSGGSGGEETVVGVFGQEIAMIDVSRADTALPQVSQFTRGLLAKAAAAIANPNPSPDTGTPSPAGSPS